MARGSSRGGGFRPGGRSQSGAGRSGRGGGSRPQRQPKGACGTWRRWNPFMCPILPSLTLAPTMSGVTRI